MPGWVMQPLSNTHLASGSWSLFRGNKRGAEKKRQNAKLIVLNGHHSVSLHSLIMIKT